MRRRLRRRLRQWMFELRARGHNLRARWLWFYWRTVRRYARFRFYRRLPNGAFELFAAGRHPFEAASPRNIFCTPVDGTGRSLSKTLIAVRRPIFNLREVVNHAVSLSRIPHRRRIRRRLRLRNFGHTLSFG